MTLGHHGGRRGGLRLGAGLCLAAAGVVCLLTASRNALLHAQDPAAQEPERPTFRLEANYVRVDAYPTVDGQPVADLTADDFEILEDGKPQQVEQFERVQLSGLTAREERRDPVSVADAREQAGDPRRRVFVVYLDTFHTTFTGSHRAREPLVNMLERLIGPDDLFAVMTPTMAARDIVFARRTDILDRALAENWTWGQRDALIRTDPEDQQLQLCFPENAPPSSCTGPGGRRVEQEANAYQGIAAQLIRRKYEEQVIASLEDLIGYLGIVREERKAVIMVTQGWQLYRPKPELVQLQNCDPVPGPGSLGTGPDGRITGNTARARSGNAAGTWSDLECMERAIRYARLDNHQRFIEMMQRANRFNVSFYPFDTRGLAVSDTMMGDRDERIRNDPGEWPTRTTDPQQRALRNSMPMVLDQETLMRRLDSMRTLAENTDGLAVVNTNDLDAGAARIVNDLSTYYLLGYYSSNRDLDGKWRNITVRVKRPGVDVRARRGYRALRTEDMLVASPEAATAAAGGAGDAVAHAEAAAVGTAIGSLAGARDGLPMHSRAAWYVGGPSAAGGSDGATASGRLWVATELDAALAREPGWAEGGTLTVTLADVDGAPLGESETALAPTIRVAEASLPLPSVPRTGELVVRLRLRGGPGTLPLTDVLRVPLDGAGTARVGAARLQRWGPSTGRRYVAAADPRFRRTDRLRVEVPVAPGAPTVSAELLDRTGAALPAIPVKAGLGTPDADGVVWATADLTLAPLSAGDYVVRVTVTHEADTAQALTGFRILP